MKPIILLLTTITLALTAYALTDEQQAQLCAEVAKQKAAGITDPDKIAYKLRHVTWQTTNVVVDQNPHYNWNRKQLLKKLLKDAKKDKGVTIKLKDLPLDLTDPAYIEPGLGYPAGIFLAINLTYEYVRTHGHQKWLENPVDEPEPALVHSNVTVKTDSKELFPFVVYPKDVKKCLAQ